MLQVGLVKDRRRSKAGQQDNVQVVTGALVDNIIAL